MDDVNADAKSIGYRWIEVLTGPARRRKWSDEQKARIVAETLEPDAVVTEVARRWQVCPQQVFGWRREMRRGRSGAAMDFVPIVAEAPAGASPAPPETSPSPVLLSEVELAGALLRIVPGTGPALLTTVLRALRASAT
jgi:transposase